MPATRGLVSEFSQRHGVAIGFAHDSLPSSLPPEVALCLFRIVQESLNNIAKHSQARSVEVRVAGTAGGVRLTIADDGIGFNASEAESRGGLGFVSMRERLRALRGTLRVDSKVGEGTRIDVYVPASSLVATELPA